MEHAGAPPAAARQPGREGGHRQADSADRTLGVLGMPSAADADAPHQRHARYPHEGPGT